MTEQELSEMERSWKRRAAWLARNQGANGYSEAEPALEQAIADIEMLLAEVRRLQGELGAVKVHVEECPISWHQGALLFPRWAKPEDIIEWTHMLFVLTKKEGYPYDKR